MAVFRSSFTSCFPDMLLRYFLNYFDMVPVVLVITSIIFIFPFHMGFISIVRPLYFKVPLAYFALLLLSSSSPLCRVFTVIYLKQTMFLGYAVSQLFRAYC
jgi:hypothetical protein